MDTTTTPTITPRHGCTFVPYGETGELVFIRHGHTCPQRVRGIGVFSIAFLIPLPPCCRP